MCVGRGSGEYSYMRGAGMRYLCIFLSKMIRSVFLAENRVVAYVQISNGRSVKSGAGTPIHPVIRRVNHKTMTAWWVAMTCVCGATWPCRRVAKVVCFVFDG